MRISDTLTEILLKRSGKFTKKQLLDLHKQSISSKKPLQDIVVHEHLITESELAALYAEELNIPFIMLPIGSIDPHVLRKLPEHVAFQYNVAVFDIDESDGVIRIAMEDPTDEEALQFLRKVLGDNLQPHLTTPTLLRAAHDQYRSLRSADQLVSLSRNTRPENERSNALIDENAIAKSVHYIIEDAINSGASHIHIEPHVDHTVIRYRIDGLLHEAHRIPIRNQNFIVNYIKSESNLKLADIESPKNGRWKITFGENEYELHVSIIPTIDGEKVSIAIIQGFTKAPGLRDIGLWGENLQKVHNALTEPQGILLVAAPDGSGKSTTILAALGALASPHISIATIEDPITYRIPGINQIEAKSISGITMESGLKALIQADANVIMISNVYGKSVIEQAVKAAHSGHLIIGGVHAPSSLHAAKQLLDNGIEAHMFSSVLRAIIAQRLPRKLCPDCREAYVPDAKTLKQIHNIVEHGGIKKLHVFEKQALDEGLGIVTSGKTAGHSNEPSSTSREILRLWKAHDKGCDNCRGTGYVGRVGIYEVLVPTAPIHAALAQNDSVRKLISIAEEANFITMEYDGLIKALRGITSLAEVHRVLSIHS